MLTKNSFPFPHLFLCYKTLKRTKNNFYKKFSSKQNEEEVVALADHEEDDLQFNKETTIMVDQEDIVKADQEETTMVDKQDTVVIDERE